jgi:hypothetical protein
VTQIEQVIQDFHHHETFCRESLQIRNKSGETVPFELYPAPRKLNLAIEEARKKAKPGRFIYLKARQVMVSAGFAAEAFHRVPFHPGQRALIVAHEDRACKNIYSYYKQLQDGYKPFRDVIELPAVRKDAREAGVIEWVNGSRIDVLTAKNLAGGRSGSFRILHLSEFAFWPDAKTLMTGLMQCVPDDPDTCVLKESTANGKGGQFYKDWQEAYERTGVSEWTALFCGWHEHPENTRKIENRAQFQASLSAEEIRQIEAYNLTLEQLHWRRWAIRAKCGGSVDAFKQEHPGCPEDAFLASGRPRFSLPALAKMPKVDNAMAGEVSVEMVGPKEVIRFHESERGAVILYKRPGANKQYVAGIDVSEGIDPALKAGGESDPDFGVANFFDRDTGEQVCKVRARMEPAEFARYVAIVARWFNWAFLVPEANGPGIAFIEGILREDYPPALIYHRRLNPDEQFKDDSGTTLQLLGWKTSAVTRVQMISKLDAAIREFSVILHDPNTIAEHESFVIKANGRAEHQDGAHDDEVFATGLGVIGLEHPPPDRRLIGVATARPPQLGGTLTSQRYGSSRLNGARDGSPRGGVVRLR